MVKGLMSQFTVVVMASPFGWRRTPAIALKSICAIMGKIIAHISTAIGIDTCAYSKRERASGMAGATGLAQYRPQSQRRPKATDSVQKAPYQHCWGLPSPDVTCSLLDYMARWLTRLESSSALSLRSEYRSVSRSLRSRTSRVNFTSSSMTSTMRS